MENHNAKKHLKIARIMSQALKNVLHVTKASTYTKTSVRNAIQKTARFVNQIKNVSNAKLVCITTQNQADAKNVQQIVCTV